MGHDKNVEINSKVKRIEIPVSSEVEQMTKTNTEIQAHDKLQDKILNIKKTRRNRFELRY